MNALEFSTKIEKGLIHLPQEFQAYNDTFVRIIVLVETPTVPSNKKEKLLATLKKMKHLNMFSSIENPILWQKKLRDEWE